MSLHDSAENLEPAIANLPAETFNKIIQILKKQGTPDTKDDIKKYPAIKWREFDVHDFSGPSPVDTPEWSEYLDNLNIRGYHRIPPQTPLACPLVETITNTGMDFSTGISGDFSKKYGGGVKLDGTSYITITSDSILNVTDEITIIGWIYKTGSQNAKDVVKKNNQYHLYFSGADTLSFRVYISGAWQTPVSITLSNNTWTHFAATYKSASSGQKIYKDAVLGSSDSVSGAIATSSNALGIAHDGAGSAILVSGARLAWLSILHDEMSLSQIQAHHAGMLNTRDSPEIVTYPFTINPNYETDMSPGNYRPH